MKRRPLVLSTLALAAGILAATLWSGLLWILLAGFLVCGFASMITRRPRWLMGMVLCLCALLGFIRYRIASSLSPGDVSHLAPARVLLTGIVDSEVETHHFEGVGGAGSYTLARFILRAQQIESRRGVGTAQAVRIVPAVGNIEAQVPLRKAYSDTDVTHNTGQNDGLHIGDVVTVLGNLETPNGPRNPGAFDDRAYLAHRNIYATLTVHRPEDWHIDSDAVAESAAFTRFAYRLKQGVLDHDHRALPPVQAGVLDAILMGEKEDLPPGVQDAFARTGVSHLLATAGLHVGLVVGMLLFALPLLRFTQRPALLATLAGLVLYTAMAGERASILRAATMAGVYLIGILLEREPDLPNALSLAAMGLLLANPFNLFEPGFQFSFVTVLTLILGMPLTAPWRRRIQERMRGDGPDRKAVRFLADYVAACLFLAAIAQLGSLPLTAYYFYEVSPVSILANTLVVPIIAPVIALGFTSAALGALWTPLSLPFDGLLNVLTAYILNVVNACDRLPFAVVSVAPPPVLLVCCYYPILWLGLWRLGRRALQKSAIPTATPLRTS